MNRPVLRNINRYQWTHLWFIDRNESIASQCYDWLLGQADEHTQPGSFALISDKILVTSGIFLKVKNKCLTVLEVNRCHGMMDAANLQEVDSNGFIF